MQPSLFEKFPRIYHSPISEKLKAFVRSYKFGYIISTILIINLLAVVVETTVRLTFLEQLLDLGIKIHINMILISFQHDIYIVFTF